MPALTENLEEGNDDGKNQKERKKIVSRGEGIILYSYHQSCQSDQAGKVIRTEIQV